MEKVAEHGQLLRVVRAALPPSIAEHADYCVVSGNRLLIYTDSSIWASQIRFYRDPILNGLGDSGQQNITDVRVKILFQFDDGKKNRTARLPSAETVQSMLGAVNENSDDVLDKALAKLAETLKKCLGN
ncbi:DciA family protein [Methylomonas sp. MgM2]